MGSTLLKLRPIQRRGLRYRWHIQPMRRRGDLDVKILTRDYHFSFRLIRAKFGWAAAITVIAVAVVDLIRVYFGSK